MYLIKSRNVNEAFLEALALLSFARRRESRNGPVVKMPTPVTTMYERPTERVLFHERRDANPFFHLFESLWMLAGRRDVEPMRWYVRRMETFSDDGEVFHGAYGYRWIHFFQIDQLEIIVERLRTDPDDRRSVLGMWSPASDLGLPSQDIPCNLVAHFGRGFEGELNMTVFCRSNDIVWGCYGANAVHFSVLQEYVAARIGCRVGCYWQVSDDWHAYVDVVKPLLGEGPGLGGRDPYTAGAVEPFPLVRNASDWDCDLLRFMERVDESTMPMARQDYREPFFNDVAVPMHMAYAMHKERRYDQALEWQKKIRATDWAADAERWILKRKTRWEERQ